jgi:hypothetical protein
VEPTPTVALAAELRKPRSATRAPDSRCHPGPSKGWHHSRPAFHRSALFSNMSGDADQSISPMDLRRDSTALSKWRWFLVLARNSTFTFKGKSVSIRQIGEALCALRAGGKRS